MTSAFCHLDRWSHRGGSTLQTSFTSRKVRVRLPPSPSPPPPCSVSSHVRKTLEWLQVVAEKEEEILRVGKPSRGLVLPSHVYFRSSVIPEEIPEFRLTSEEGQNMKTYWSAGEDEALLRLQSFLKERLGGYSVKKDFPTCDKVTSLLSPYLAVGSISARTWSASFFSSSSSSSHISSRFLLFKSPVGNQRKQWKAHIWKWRYPCLDRGACKSGLCPTHCPLCAQSSKGFALPV